jgi:hypothetical protein
MRLKFASHPADMDIWENLNLPDELGLMESIWAPVSGDDQVEGANRKQQFSTTEEDVG